MNNFTESNLKQYINYWTLTIALTLISIITYRYSLHVPFLIDDFAELPPHNPFDFYNTVPQQAVKNLILWCYFALFGNQAFFYHLFNLIFLNIASLLIFKFLLSLFENRLIAFIAPLLFLIHPINNLMVNYANAVNLILQIIFLVVSLDLVIRKAPNKIQIDLSIFCYMLAILCHDTVFHFPLYIMLIRRLKYNESFGRVFKYSLPFIIVSVVFILIGLSQGRLDKIIIQNLDSSAITWAQFFATFGKLILWYLKQLVIPDAAVMMATINIIKDNLFLHICIFGLLIAIYFLILYRLYSLKEKYYFLGLTWLGIGFLPVILGCVKFMKYGLTIEPHWLYFSSIGFFICVARLFYQVYKTFCKAFFSITLASYIVLLISSSYLYISLWSDEIKYCSFWLKSDVALESYTNIFMGTYYMRERQMTKAKQLFNNAIVEKKSDVFVYNNLGSIYEYEGDLKLAKKYYILGLQMCFFYDLNPKISYYNLGYILNLLNDTLFASYFLEFAIDKDPYFYEARTLLGKTYMKLNEYKKAENLYLGNIALSKRFDADTFLNLMDVYIKLQEYQVVQNNSKNIIQASQDSIFLFALGDLLMSNNLIDEAISSYKRAIQFDSRFNNSTKLFFESDTASNLCKLIAKSKIHLDQSIKIDSTNNEFYQQIITTCHKN